jgi:hypothetical protein
MTTNWTRRGEPVDAWEVLSAIAFLLNEDGSHLLNEDGSRILLELSKNAIWGNQCGNSTNWNNLYQTGTVWDKKNKPITAWQ